MLGEGLFRQGDLMITRDPLSIFSWFPAGNDFAGEILVHLLLVLDSGSRAATGDGYGLVHDIMNCNGMINFLSVGVILLMVGIWWVGLWQVVSWVMGWGN